MTMTTFGFLRRGYSDRKFSASPAIPILESLCGTKVIGMFVKNGFQFDLLNNNSLLDSGPFLDGTADCFIALRRHFLINERTCFTYTNSIVRLACASAAANVSLRLRHIMLPFPNFPNADRLVPFPE